jgi:hypothetical protein
MYSREKKVVIDRDNFCILGGERGERTNAQIIALQLCTNTLYILYMYICIYIGLLHFTPNDFS